MKNQNTFISQYTHCVFQTGNFFAQGYEFDIKSPSIALQYPAVSFPYIVDGTCNIHNEFHTPDIPNTGEFYLFGGLRRGGALHVR